VAAKASNILLIFEFPHHSVSDQLCHPAETISLNKSPLAKYLRLLCCYLREFLERKITINQKN
jgi:hypothetical protein